MKAVQSAMAIRRQRRRRDDAVKAKARRSSHQSDHYMLSESREGSQMSLDGVGRHGTSRRHQMMGGVTTFHVGIVFLIMGLMLVISGLVPGYTNRQRQYWEENKPGSSFWSDREGYGNAALLLATGSFLIMVGVALVVANRIASKKEDEQFTRYISRKLATARLTHHPVSSLHAVSKHSQHQEVAVAIEDDDEESPGQQPQQQLESITEEAEGSSAASKDQLFWTNDVAPVHKQSNHHHHHHHHHHHGSSTG